MATQTVPTTVSSKWSVVREALAGTHQDFTEGSLSRGIALLAIPTMLEMGMESTFGIVDAFWVAGLGANAIAAVGLSESLIVLVFSVAFGLAMAATAMIARRIGEKDPEGASVAAVQAIGCGIAVAVVSGITGAVFAPQLLGLMHATPEVIREGSGYTRVLLGGDLSIILIFLINGIFRGSGDATRAMRTLWLANLINLALDPCLIYGFGPFPKFGVMGAAVATCTGRSIGVLYQLWVLFSGQSRVALARRHIRLNGPVMRRLLRLSWTCMFQYFVAIASWVSLARINAGFGSAAVAGYTLAIRIIMFALMPSWGICSAAATLVGQNLGAHRPDRSERAVWLGGVYNMALLTVVGIVFFSAAGLLVQLLHQRYAGGGDRRGVSEAGLPRLPVLCLGHDHGAGVQRRGRHMDADPDQPGLLLDAPDPAGVDTLAAHGAGPARRVPGDLHSGIDAGAGVGAAVPAWTVEGGEDLKAAHTCRGPTHLR